MMRYPLTNLLNDDDCYNYLKNILHPDGMKCPHGHPLPPEQSPHDRSRAPIVDYREHSLKVGIKQSLLLMLRMLSFLAYRTALLYSKNVTEALPLLSHDANKQKHL